MNPPAQRGKAGGSSPLLYTGARDAQEAYTFTGFFSVTSRATVPIA